MAFSRREFLTRVGHAGGYSAAFLAMQGMGLAEASPVPKPAPLQAPAGSGKGVKVVVAGAGIAGLVSAYELRALGYDVTLLESRKRPGGRNYSVRGGDTVTFMDGTQQQCTWDDGHYQNFGPARLPSIHPTILSYCKKLGVELQVEVNMSRSAHLQNDNANGGRPAVMRQVVNDTRGHVSELLMKCMNQGALDADISKEDRDRMMGFLRIYGPLDNAGKYAGSDRSGYSHTAGAGDDTGVLNEPIDMHTLLDEGFWQGMLFDEQFDMQATMFQPVGGMDRIPYAFAKSLGDIVRYDSPVTGIHKTAKGVSVEYTQGGAKKSIVADYCICAMPLTILKKTANDFEAPYRKVISECTYAGAYKVAWESRRFWEQDYNIYGGLEFVNVGCSPIWLPSAGLFSERGIVVSGYTDEVNSAFGKMSLEEKLAESRKSIERLHPGHGKELEKPIYFGWSKAEWNEGSWIRSYGPGQDRGGNGAQNGGAPSARGALTAGATGTRPGQAPGMEPSRQTGAAQAPAAARALTNPGYETLVQPDGPVIFAGDHVSHIVAWQEGAALSGLRAVQQLSEKTKAARLAGTLPAVYA